MIASHFSTGKVSIGLTCWIPALLTRMSILPEARDAVLDQPAGAGRIEQIGPVIGDFAAMHGELAAGRVDRIGLAETIYDDVCTGLRECAGDAQADAAGRSGNHGDAAVEDSAGIGGDRGGLCIHDGHPW